MRNEERKGGSSTWAESSRKERVKAMRNEERKGGTSAWAG